MNIQFLPVTEQNQIVQLASIADNVWHEYFPGIITIEQIDYMVEQFQSEKAIFLQMQQGYQYFFLELNGIYIGYIGVHPEMNRNRMFLSKLYILKPYRGKGYASQAFAFLQGYTEACGLHSIYLTVNRKNTLAIDCYKHWGFDVLREEAADIGQGFVMDDYIMEYGLKL